MDTNQFTVLNDLIKFSGNPKVGEKPRPSIDLKTFLRSLESFFANNDITSDQRKITVFFALIDKEYGDAIDLVTCYSGVDIAYDDLVADFLKAYPTKGAQEFAHAARSLLEARLSNPTFFSGMTRLDMTSRAAVETFLDKPTYAKLGLTVKSTFKVPTVDQDRQSRSSSPDRDDDEEDAEVAIQQKVKVKDLLQSFAMHLVLASQLDKKAYEKIEGLNCQTPCTKLMATTIEVAEKQRLDKAVTHQKKHRHESQELLFGIHPNNNSPRGHGQRQSHNNQSHYRNNQPAPTTNNGNPGPNKPSSSTTQTQYACTRCGKNNHATNDCKFNLNCSFCNVKGHAAKVCRKRLRLAKGKYCSNCNIRDSHSNAECFRNNPGNRPPQKTTQQNVNWVGDADDRPDNPDYDMDEDSQDEEHQDPNSE